MTARPDWRAAYEVAVAARSQVRAAVLEELMRKDGQHAGVIAALATLLG